MYCNREWDERMDKYDLKSSKPGDEVDLILLENIYLTVSKDCPTPENHIRNVLLI